MNPASSTSRKQSIVVFVGSLVMIVLVVYLSSVLTPSTGTSSASQCSEPVPSFNASRTAEVFQLTPGSPGLICVNYIFRGVGIYTFSADFGPWVGQGQGSSYYGCGYWPGMTEVNTLCSEVTISSSPHAVISLRGLNVTVTYTIRSNQSATGFYWFFIANCYPVDLAFGPLPTWGPPSSILSCLGTPYAPSSVTVTGVSNLNVVVIPEN